MMHTFNITLYTCISIKNCTHKSYKQDIVILAFANSIEFENMFLMRRPLGLGNGEIGLRYYLELTVKINGFCKLLISYYHMYRISSINIASLISTPVQYYSNTNNIEMVVIFISSAPSNSTACHFVTPDIIAKYHVTMAVSSIVWSYNE